MKALTPLNRTVLIVAALAIVAFLAVASIRASGGAKGTATSTVNNLRQPVANTKGLVAWYPLDGDSKDYSGNNNNGMLVNFTYDGTTNGYTGGKFGKGLLFNGNNEYIQTTSSSIVGTDPTSSVSAWVKLPETIPAGEIDIYSENWNVSGGPVYVLQLNNGVPSFNINQVSAGWFYASDTSSLKPGSWNNLVGTLGADGMKLYVNGILSGSNTNTQPTDRGGIAYSNWK